MNEDMEVGCFAVLVVTRGYSNVSVAMRTTLTLPGSLKLVECGSRELPGISVTADL